MQQDPTTIGRYQVLRLLGQGAMGVVYLAMDPLLKRQVAIKVVTAIGEDAALALARFQREAEISARLNHPNIVTVYDVGQDPLVGPFLAMEYVEGTSLSKLIHNGIPLELGLRLLAQGVGALLAAEAQGIVHRDIKPDNVLVSADGRFKLMDFGIARRDESHLTQAGMIFGTPSYTAPELLTGSDASIHTDRYAFAVTAFEIVFGTQPFHGTSVGSTLYRIVHEPPTCPEGTAPYLKAVFEKALAKQPEARYQDLPTFLSALVEAVSLPEESRIKLLAYIGGEHPFGSTQPLGPNRLAILQAAAAPAPPRFTVPLQVPSKADPVPVQPTVAMASESHPEPPLIPEAVEAEPEPIVQPEAPAEPLPTSPEPTALLSADAIPEAAPEDAPETAPEGDVIPAMQDAQVPEPQAEAPGASVPDAEVPQVARTEAFVLPAPDAVQTPAPTPIPSTDPAPDSAPASVPAQPSRRSPALLFGGIATAAGILALIGFLALRKPATPPQAPAPVASPSVKTDTEPDTAQPVAGTLNVITDPPGAEVLLNDKPVGVTPLKGLAISGKHPRLTLRLAGYQEWSAEVDPDLPFEPVHLSPLRRGKR